MLTTPAKAVGRPRNPAIDAAVLAATRAALEEQGFSGATIQEVARRTGVHPPAIYRRWPNRISLVEDAVWSEVVEVPIEPTGKLRADLLRLLTAFEAMLDRPAARAAIPGLLAAYHSGRLELPVDRWAHLSIRPQLDAILRAAAPEELDPGVDVDELWDLLLGAMLARIVIPPLSAPRRPLEQIVGLIVRILRPEPTPNGGDLEGSRTR